MSRVRNASEFLLKFRRIQNDYQKLFAPRIKSIRLEYTDTPSKYIDSSLEHHVREYVVNAVLAALNWRADRNPQHALPNLIPEAPLQSQQTGRIRRLDYLGLEKDTNTPLLIVETKRPSAKLPDPITLIHSPPATLTHSETIVRGLQGQHLGSEWNKWLIDIKDYVCSVHEKTQNVPRRVVITNGDWLVLFLDPSDSFLETGAINSATVLVFTDSSDIEARYSELFNDLEFESVLGKTRPLALGELAFHIEGTALDRVMHGLRLRYIEQPGIFNPKPILKVAPMLFLRSKFGNWLHVENPPAEFEIPHAVDELQEHLENLGSAGRDLLSEVNCRLSIALQPSPLSRHYDDEDTFNALHGIVECSNDEYKIVTGDETHYIRKSPSIQKCPYHDWSTCNVQHVATGSAPIFKQSIAPRSFFVSGDLHHCAHKDVSSAKEAEIKLTNRKRCGQRSGRDGDAFCEIWRFEQHLCCRTCVFEEVCTKADVFKLPCGS